MARPIWTGSLSFGLLNIPVSLMAGERKVDLSFRMLDSRDKKPVRYERVNSETGEEVPWKEIVKAFEYDKGSYVVIEPDDFKSAAPERHETIDVEAFVDIDDVGRRFFDRPYVLVPASKAEKGYVLLRETLKETGKAGLARVVIRTREHLCLVVPENHALVLLLLRYPQELVEPTEYGIPEGSPSSYRIAAKEIEMAKQLVRSMSEPWKPQTYKDEFRDRLAALIQKRIKSKGGKTRVEPEPPMHEDAATNVVDFMALLEKSLKTNKRTPARSSSKAGKKAAKKSTPAKKAARKKG